MWMFRVITTTLTNTCISQPLNAVQTNLGLAVPAADNINKVVLLKDVKTQ